MDPQEKLPEPAVVEDLAITLVWKINAAQLLFLECSSMQLVRARTAGGEQMGARTLFAAMPRGEEPPYDDPDWEMLDIIHEGGRREGSYEDRKVDNSEPT